MQRDWIENGWENDISNEDAWIEYLCWKRDNRIQPRSNMISIQKIDVDDPNEELQLEDGWVNEIIPGLRGGRIYIRKGFDVNEYQCCIHSLDDKGRDENIFRPELSGVEVWVNIPGLGIHFLSADASGNIRIRFTY